MEKISINKNGLGIFKPNAKKNAVQKAPGFTNPFGLHFKGSVIQADVFETPKTTTTSKVGLKEKIANSGRVFKSSIVGGLNSFNNALKSRANSIISFGRQAKEKITQAIDFANNYDVGQGIKQAFGSIYNRFAENREYSVQRLVKRPVEDLRGMLEAELNAAQVA